MRFLLTVSWFLYRQANQSGEQNVAFEPLKLLLRTIFILASCFLLPCPTTASPPSNFEETIAPILSSYCIECHQGPEPKADLNLTERTFLLTGGKNGAALVPGQPTNSLIWQRILADEMPPKKPLGPAEKTALHDWIARGAPWDGGRLDPFQKSTLQRAGYDWWSLQTLKKTEVPPSTDPSLVRNEIDSFILARLNEKGLSPSPPADARILVRRLYYDVLGLPPPPENTVAFIHDPSPAKWENLVDELLASPHYGERWARHWLDIARFGESDGYEYNNARRNAWPYRDWVIQALNQDLPYNEFTRMQIAGDILKPSSLDGLAAVGFLVAGIHNTVLGQSPAMKAAGRHEELAELAGVIGQTFLGLTVHCARCHDHKYDPISMKDYYSFIAALDGVTHGERSLPSSAVSNLEIVNLKAQRLDLQSRLNEKITERNGWKSSSANELTLKQPLEANVSGVLYRISARLAPTVWASREQATQENDGVVIYVLRQDQSVLASQRWASLPWNEGKNESNYELKSFTYRGDGSGSLLLKLSPTPLNSNRFGGALDDLQVQEIETQQILFSDSFDDLKLSNVPGVQADTKKKVFFGALSDRWNSSGINAIHAVEYLPNNLALQLYAGHGEKAKGTALSDEEIHLQIAIQNLDQKILLLEKNLPAQIFSVVPKQPDEMHILHRGEVTRPGQVVSPNGLVAIQKVNPSFLLETNAPDEARRERLADWITHADNGPFHRVMVNRVWHYYFGRGMVSTPSDFGFNGRRPTHPDLLEWLAVWFRDNHYSLKKLHRLILTSSTYRQSSNARNNPSADNAAALDAENTLLWRQNPRRIDAETFRDSLLEVAGCLNRELFGPGYVDVQQVVVPPANYWVDADPVGFEFQRRTLYRWQARGERSALLETFDCPDPSTTTPVRMITTTPLQALSQWNHPLVLRMANNLANQVIVNLELTTDQQVDELWLRVLGRLPDAEEKAEAIHLVHSNGLTLLARVLFNCNEWIWIE